MLSALSTLDPRRSPLVRQLARQFVSTTVVRQLLSTKVVRRQRGIRGLYRYLRTIGWVQSVESENSVNGRGEPVPWYTYSATAFLDGRLRRSMRVFEYGSGNSTLWWASRVSTVVSCEHDPSWYAQVEPRLPSSVQYVLRDLSDAGDYSGESARHGGDFHIVVIDGRDRNRCASRCLEALHDTGVIIWDNTERTEYASGMEMLRQAGFNRLDFEGLGPINAYPWQTSVFYRAGNCLGL